jgi:hypothetical protein
MLLANNLRQFPLLAIQFDGGEDCDHFVVFRAAFVADKVLVGMTLSPFKLPMGFLPPSSSGMRRFL